MGTELEEPTNAELLEQTREIKSKLVEALKGVPEGKFALYAAFGALYSLLDDLYRTLGIEISTITVVAAELARMRETRDAQNSPE